MTALFLALTLIASIKDSIIIQTRFADGRAATGIVARVLQVTESGDQRVAGQCTTDSAGRCTLNFELTMPVLDDPLLELVGYKFAPAFGLHGDLSIYPIPTNHDPRVAFILDTPIGVLTDKNPTGIPMSIVTDRMLTQVASMSATPQVVVVTAEVNAFWQITPSPPALTPSPAPYPTPTSSLVADNLGLLIAIPLVIVFAMLLRSRPQLARRRE